MSRKAVTALSGKVIDGTVILTWYKSTPYCPDNEQNADEFSEFSVYRKQTDEFEFNNDYAEFFYGLVPGTDELIFHGPLECSNNRKYTFRDECVKTGKTYAYFVKSKNTDWAGPVPVKVRDTRVWWSYEKLIAELNQLQQEFPQLIELGVCGRTVEGREIYSLKAGYGKPYLGLIGAVHPGEAGPELIVSALRRLLQEHPETLDGKSIVAIPSVNIDQREKLAQGNPWYLRVNTAGVDLNRNFPADWEVVAKNYGLSSDEPGSMTYRGTSPGSEPETQAVINFFTANVPECIFSFHALAGICDLPALTAGGSAADDKAFRETAQAFAFTYGSGLHPELKPDDSWLSFGGTEGGFTRWAWQALSIPAYDLELSMKIAPEALTQCRTDLTDIKLLDDYIERHYRAIKRIMSEGK